MATFSSATYTNNVPPNTGHGVTNVTCHLHATVAIPSTAATADVINFGYIPANAVVVGVILKAASQLDSSTGLTLSIGPLGSGTLWKSGITTVGRASGVSSDSTIATAGGLYKSPAKILIIGTVTAGPTTGVAGNLECDIAYYVEDVAGSQA